MTNDSLGAPLARFETLQPKTLTFITTYTCTAACAECCFECTPKLTGRLERQFILDRIDEAVTSFPSLEVVVFTGGECFLLGQDLFDAIAHCTAVGKLTRCVSNGYWGRSEKLARRNAQKLKDAGLTEINFSTGVDHAEWVPVESVINATLALAELGIRTLITVEKDLPDTDILGRIKNDPRIQEHLYRDNALVSVVTNVWMPFHTGSSERQAPSSERAEEGCKQLFHNIVITPHKRHSACCGLTLEHIPEMHLAFSGERSLREAYDSQFDDFLKLWIHTDGPHAIVRKLLGEAGDELLQGVEHTCQACAILHQSQPVIEQLRSRYHEFVPGVMASLRVRETLQSTQPLVQLARSA